MTMQKLLTERLEIHHKEHIKARTYSRYQGLILTHIVPTLGKKTYQKLDDVRFRNSLLSRKRTAMYEMVKNYPQQAPI